jgi:hypothetical protein
LQSVKHTFQLSKSKLIVLKKKAGGFPPASNFDDLEQIRNLLLGCDVGASEPERDKRRENHDKQRVESWDQKDLI